MEQNLGKERLLIQKIQMKKAMVRRMLSASPNSIPMTSFVNVSLHRH